LASEVADANKFFFFRHINKRPFITIKIASSSDGMSHAEDGSIKWITSPAAREDVQHLRAEHDAIITGGNTVRNDNPQMNARVDYPINQPKKILLSSESNWDKGLKFFDAPVSIIDSRNLQDVLHSLIDEDICSALVEAGPSLVNAFLEDGLCEELVVYQSPNPIGVKGVSWFDEGNTIEKFGFKRTSSYTIDRDKKTSFVKC
jgi:diaminohydroxyphosphoribosylaminopyrimidine deaminase/5-amino-6-(5-phosphoribosylamino)uracil reductase